MSSSHEELGRSRCPGAAAGAATDLELLELHRIGDEGAFEQVISRHLPEATHKLRLRYQVSEDEAVELFLLGFTELVFDLPRRVLAIEDPEGCVLGYVLGIIRYQWWASSKGTRERSLSSVTGDLMEAVTEGEPIPENLLNECLESLPLKNRRAFVAKEIEGRSLENVGRELQVSPTVVGELVACAKRRMRAYALEAHPSLRDDESLENES